ALVIGCEDAEPVLLLAREFPSARVRGVDPSPERVRAAGARIGLDPEGRVAFKRGGARSLPFPDAFFELVVVLEGWVGPVELARVLRPGAHLVFAGEGQGELAGGLRGRIRRRQLVRRGIVAAEPGAAERGNFFVARFEPAE